MKNASAERARRTDKLGNAVRRPDLTRESMMRPARRRWPASLCEWAHRPPMLAMSWPDDGQPRAHRGPRPWTDLIAGALQTRRCRGQAPGICPPSGAHRARHGGARTCVRTCVNARPAHIAPGRPRKRRNRFSRSFPVSRCVSIGAFPGAFPDTQMRTRPMLQGTGCVAPRACRGCERQRPSKPGSKTGDTVGPTVVTVRHRGQPQRFGLLRGYDG